MAPDILIVDDEQDACDILKDLLEIDGFKCRTANSAQQLEELLDQKPPDLVLLDLLLPDGNGLDLLPIIKTHWPITPVIMLTGFGTIEKAVDATKKGAFQFLTKPINHTELLEHIRNALQVFGRKKVASAEDLATNAISLKDSVLFRSGRMKKVVDLVRQVAPSDVTLLLTGESGVGKEVICDLIHQLSPRQSRPLVKINCAALPNELIESELFGSVKGAFTGANSNRIGLFRQAENGTLMLDEISEMPIDTQSKLLRVLQEKTVRPVGSEQSHPIQCRIVAATNRNIQEAIEKGKIREDLYYRISTVTIEIPPLRERRDDILPLAQFFMQRFAAESSKGLEGFSMQAQEGLLAFDWPGNVRQLQNEIHRAVLLCPDKVIDLTHFSDVLNSADPKSTQNGSLESVEKNAILQILEETAGNKLETARRLGVGRQTLYNKLKKYGIS